MSGEKKLLAKDAADVCGVTTNYLLNQAKMGRVAYVQPSPRRIMFTKPDLDKWMSSWRKVEAQTAG
jgi:hypothetical protein